MDFKEAVDQFLTLISSVKEESKLPFLKWLQSTTDDLIEQSRDESDEVIERIRSDLRNELPLSAVLDSETINTTSHFEQTQRNGIVRVSPRVHVDGFLYDDADVDEFCDKGSMSRNYCVDCGSHKVAPLDFISHSTSVNELKYIFHYLLPNLNGRSVLDVGSRLGPVLYGAYLYSQASAIFGCEMNADLCRIQQKVVEKYRFQDRVKVICADIRTQTDLLRTADVIIFNNVFQEFFDTNEQRQIWQFLRQAVVRQGTVLVMSPSVEESLEPLETGIAIENWLRKENVSSRLIDAKLNLFGSDDSDDNSLDEIHLYTVL